MASAGLKQFECGVVSVSASLRIPRFYVGDCNVSAKKIETKMPKEQIRICCLLCPYNTTDCGQSCLFSFPEALHDEEDVRENSF